MPRAIDKAGRVAVSSIESRIDDVKAQFATLDRPRLLEKQHDNT